MKYYIKVDENNIIIDITSFYTTSSIEIETENLPIDILLYNVYQYIDGEILLNEDLYDQKNEEFLINNLDQYLLEELGV